MNTPQQARNGGRAARHARAGPESVLASIRQPPAPEAAAWLPPDRPRTQSPYRDTRIAKRVVRGWRYLLPLFASGTVATTIAAVRALDWPVDPRPGAGPWLIAAVAAALGTASLSAVARMYRDRQETRRKEIEQHPSEVLAAAMARAIDATHTRAQNLSGAKEMEEAARVRASAGQVTVDLVAAITSLAQVPPPAISPERHEAAPRPETAQLADPVHAN
jgi:hypothetical protein